MYFCSAIFVPLFLFCWGLFALKPHLPHYLIDNFCSTDLFALALTNFCSATFVLLFLFRWGVFALKLKPIFVRLFLFRWGLFFFRYFCSARPFLFRYFCSAVFVLLTFLHLHLPIFVLLFLFHYFCSAVAFLHLNPIYHITL